MQDNNAKPSCENLLSHDPKPSCENPFSHDHLAGIPSCALRGASRERIPAEVGARWESRTSGRWESRTSGDARGCVLSAAVVLMLIVPALGATTTQPATDVADTVATRVEGGGTLEAVIFYSFAAVALISAIGVVISRNIVRTAICLLFTLGAMAGFYFLLAANFVGAVQLIVYAGGTLVLIIFGVMLTGRTMAHRFRARSFEVAGGVIACGVILAGLLIVLTQVPWHQMAEPMQQGPTIDQVGTELLTRYLVPFEVVSVLLLVAMIGAAYLARPERR